MNPSVLIVVVNWNRADETLDCLASLGKLDYTPYQVLVVDNGSTDQSVEQIRCGWEKVEIVETGANLGFGAGSNIGIGMALSRHFDFVWILNNDVIVEPETLRLLVEGIASNKNVGAASPKILLKKPPGCIWYAGGSFDLRFGRVKRYGHGEQDHGQWDREGTVTFATGCSLLLRTAAVRDVGLLNEHYFLYFEDVDYSYRLGLAGWTILFVPGAVIHHTSAGSSDEPGGNAALFDYYNTRNLFWFIKSNLAIKQRPLAYSYSFAYVTARCGRIIFGDETKKVRKLKSLAKGLLDGVTQSLASG